MISEDRKALRDEATRLLRDARKRPVPGERGRENQFNRFGAGGPSHNDSFVYDVGPKKSGPYKIGFAKNVVKRRAALQIGSPVALRTWGAWRCPRGTAREIEQQAHKRLDWARSHGEWFDVECVVIHQVVEQIRARVLLSAGVLEVNGVMMEDKLSQLEAFGFEGDE